MTATPDQLDLPVQRRRTGEADWSFLTRPRWILSHLFAISMIAMFIVAMFWQIDRRAERIEQNGIVAERSVTRPVSVAEALTMGTPAELDFRIVADTGRWIETDVVHVGGRSLNGAAGEWVVGLFDTGSERILVNRGFVTIGGAVEDPPDLAGPSSVRGYLRTSRVQEGLGTADTGGAIAPRLNIEAVAARLGDPEVAPMWLQLEEPTGTGFPEPVPLPALDNGPHFSYAVQWATFALLGTLIYGAVLLRCARLQRSVANGVESARVVDRGGG